MKDGFLFRRLGDVVSVQSGFAFKSTEYSDAGHFLVRIANVQDGYLDLHKPTYVTLDAKTERFELAVGDILTSLTGNVGRVARVELEHLPAALNQRVARLVPKRGAELHPQYLLRFLTSTAFSGFLEERAHGAAQANVSPSVICEVPIPLPPLEEQQRIVAVLDEAFEGLARARAHAKANLENARELFANSLFGIFHDLAATAPRLTLSEAAITFGRGKSRHRPRNAPFLYGGEYPFVQTGDIRNSNGTVTTFSQTYSEHGLAQSKLWPEGTVCITIAANIAETAVLGFDACFPDSIIGMVVDPDATFPEYVEFMLRYFSTELKALGKGSAQDNINLATFESATFPFPDIATQVDIVEKLTRLTAVTTQLTDAYQAKLQAIDTLRQSLLQKAFAGELT